MQAFVGMGMGIFSLRGTGQRDGELPSTGNSVLTHPTTDARASTMHGSVIKSVLLTGATRSQDQTSEIPIFHQSYLDQLELEQILDY